MKFRRGRAVAVAITVSAFAMVATTTSAFADEPPGGIVWDHTYTAPGVKVYVEEHGDYISVCDTSANGHAAWVDVDYAYGVDHLKVSSGAGTCETNSASDGHDLPENMEIALSFDGNGGAIDGFARFTNDN